MAKIRQVISPSAKDHRRAKLPHKRRFAWVKDRPARPSRTSAPAAAEIDTRWVTVHTGHSFVRHSKYHLLADSGVGQPQLGQKSGNGFANTTDREAESLAEHLRLSEKYSKVHFMARHINFISQILDPTQLKAILDKNPDVILVNGGTNEMSNFISPPTEFQILQLAGQLRSLAQKVPSDIKVVCMGMVPRDGRSYLSEEQFRAGMKVFNDTLQAFHDAALSGTPPTNFRYFKMAGWEYQDNNGVKEERPISDWADAGRIHPRPHMFVTKYAKSVRDALLAPKNKPAKK